MAHGTYAVLSQDAVKGKELRMAFALGEHHGVDLSDEKRLGFNKFPHGDDPTVM